MVTPKQTRTDEQVRHDIQAELNSIARWIADQHSADIQLSSEPGHGTRVLVSLPLAA